jgi:hypothetical protein
MAYTSQQLADLRNAIAEGVLTVKFADRVLTYRSLDEMRRIERAMAAELESNSTVPIRRSYFSFKRFT